MPIKQAYKINDANKYFTFISIVFPSLFALLLLGRFFLPFHPTLISGLTLLFIYLLYQHFSIDGHFSISSINGKRQISITGNTQLQENINSIQVGWSYASFNSIEGINSTMTAYISLMTNDEKTVENTLQQVVLIQLENKENIAILKELLPWQEVNKLNYIGHEMDKIEINHKIYLKGNFRKMSKQIEKIK